MRAVSYDLASLGAAVVAAVVAGVYILEETAGFVGSGCDLGL